MACHGSKAVFLGIGPSSGVALVSGRLGSEAIGQLYNSIELLEGFQLKNTRKQEIVEHNDTSFIDLADSPPPPSLCGTQLHCGHRCRELEGHIHDSETETDPCQELVGTQLPCGHIDRVPCYLLDTKVTCTAVCGAMTCDDHYCMKECSQIHDHAVCDTIVPTLCEACDEMYDVPCYEFKSKNNFHCGLERRGKFPCGHIYQHQCPDKAPSTCSGVCREKLDCKKHECSYKCSDSHDHSCNRLVVTQLHCGHRGYKLCRDNTDTSSKFACMEKVDFLLPCGHETTVLCKDLGKVVSCKTPVMITRMCGHQVKGLCGETVSGRCVEVITYMLDCGHGRTRFCSDAASFVCPQMRDGTLRCGHVVKDVCSYRKKVECRTLVEFQLACGHLLQTQCCNSKKPARCNVMSRVGACSHVFSRPCGDATVCDQTSSIRSDCGHYLDVPCKDFGMPGFQKPDCRVTSIYTHVKCGHLVTGKCAELDKNNCSKCAEERMKREPKRIRVQALVVNGSSVSVVAPGVSYAATYQNAVTTAQLHAALVQVVQGTSNPPGTSAVSSLPQTTALPPAGPPPVPSGGPHREHTTKTFKARLFKMDKLICNLESKILLPTASVLVIEVRKLRTSFETLQNDIINGSDPSAVRARLKEIVLRSGDIKRRMTAAAKRPIAPPPSVVSGLTLSSVSVVHSQTTIQAGSLANVAVCQDLLSAAAKEVARPVPKDSAEFKIVQEKMKHYIDFEVERVEKLLIRNALSRFDSVKSSLNDPLHSDLKVYTNDVSGLIRVVKDGFSERDMISGFYGMGLYFLDNFAEDQNVLRNNCLLLCDVLLGNSLTVDTPQILTENILKDMGFDSIYGQANPVAVTERYVVLDPRQAYPKYIVYFHQASLDIRRVVLQSTTFVDMTDPLQNHYRLVENEVFKAGYASKLVSIEHIQNQTTQQAFRLKELQFRTTFGEDAPESKKILSYHGTLKKNVDQILRNNFSLAMAGISGQAFGNGVYFSDSPHIALSHAKDCDHVIACYILPGRCKEIFGAENHPTYNSHRANMSGFGNITIIKSVDQILPMFVVTFRR